MKIISLSSSLSTELDPSLSHAHSIEIEDHPFAEGGFGVAYHARRVDGRNVTPQVIKILTENGHGLAQSGLDTVRELQKRLRHENSELVRRGSSLIVQYPALQAVPQISFEGKLEGRRVLGYSAINLCQCGFDEFGRLLDDPVRIAEFQTLPVSSKIRLAAQLVSAFDFLSTRLWFIHADIKADALFVNVRKPGLAIIDFDSGALARDPSDTPTTFGTRQDWLAPEIIRQLEEGGPGRHSIKVDLLSDVWSVNIAIHYLLCGVHPLFFLRELSERSIDAYFREFEWPDVDPRFPYFRREYASVYTQYARFLYVSVPSDIVKRLAFTVNKGYRDPSARTTYGQWRTVLNVVNRPSIRRFEADRTYVSDGRPIHLSWDVTGVSRLDLVGVGDVTGLTSVDVPVRRDTVFRLALTPDNGPLLVKEVRIEVDKRPPEIRAFASSVPLLTKAIPVRLNWKVMGAERLHIDNGIGNVSGRTFVDVLPKCETTYKLTAVSPFGVISQATVCVRVSTIPPSIAYFRSDRPLLTDRRPVRLTWEVSDDAYEVQICGIGLVPRKGSRSVTQKCAKVYTLKAVSYFGYWSAAELEVRVSQQPPAIEKFSVSPTAVQEGAEVVISWKVTGVDSVAIEPWIGEVPQEGNRKIRVTADLNLVLRAVTYFGAVASCNAHIRVLRRTILPASTVRTVKPTMLESSGTHLPVARTSLPGTRTDLHGRPGPALPDRTVLGRRAQRR